MNKQELIGLKVQHNMLGEGTITRFKGRSTEYCLIYFNCIKKESMFRFPDVLLDNNIFNQDNYVARVLNQQFSKIDNEYIDISGIEDYIGRCKKCGKEFRVLPIVQVYLDKHSKPYPRICKSCLIKVKQSKEKRDKEKEKQWIDSEREFALYRSLMYHSKPCSCKRTWIHNTDGMSV